MLTLSIGQRWLFSTEMRISKTDDTPRSNPACYLTEDQDEDDMIKISEDEFRVYSRALLIVLGIRDALSDLKQFFGEDEPKNITSEGKT